MSDVPSITAAELGGELEPVMALPVRTGGVVTVNACVDCAVSFGPDESCSDDRCAECAATRGYHHTGGDGEAGEREEPDADPDGTAGERPRFTRHSPNRTSAHATGGRLYPCLSARQVGRYRALTTSQPGTAS